MTNSDFAAIATILSRRPGLNQKIKKAINVLYKTEEDPIAIKLGINIDKVRAEDVSVFASNFFDCHGTDPEDREGLQHFIVSSLKDTIRGQYLSAIKSAAEATLYCGEEVLEKFVLVIVDKIVNPDFWEEKHVFHGLDIEPRSS